METERTYWWWIATEINFQNGWKSSGQKLFVEAQNEFEANEKMLQIVENELLADSQRTRGNLEGPYHSKQEAAHFAKSHEESKKAVA